jgi:hypothetical protein
MDDELALLRVLPWLCRPKSCLGGCVVTAIASGSFLVAQRIVAGCWGRRFSLMGTETRSSPRQSLLVLSALTLSLQLSEK